MSNSETPKPMPDYVRDNLDNLMGRLDLSNKQEEKIRGEIESRIGDIVDDCDINTEEKEVLLQAVLEGLEGEKLNHAKTEIGKFITEITEECTAKSTAEKPQEAETPLIIRAFGKLPSEIQTTPAEGLKIDAFLTKLSQEPVILAAYKDASVRTGKMGEIKARLQKAGDGEPLKTEMLAVLDNLATDNKVVVEKLKPYESTNKAEQLGSGFVSMLEKAGASSSMIASIIKMFVDGLQNSFPGLDLSFLDNMRWPHVAKDYRDNVIPKVLGQNGESFELSDDQIIKLGKSYESIPGSYKPKDKTEYVTNEKKPKEFAKYLSNLREKYMKLDDNDENNNIPAPEKWTYEILAGVEKGYRPTVMPPDGAEPEPQKQNLDQYITSTSLADLIKKSHELSTSVRGKIGNFIESFGEQDKNKLNTIEGDAKDFALGFQKIILEKKFNITDSNAELKITANDSFEIEQTGSKKITVKKLAEGDKWTIQQEGEEVPQPIETQTKLIEEVGKLLKPEATSPAPATAPSQTPVQTSPPETPAAEPSTE